MSDTSERSRLLLSGSSWLLCQPELAARIGKVEATVLQFTHYWIHSNNDSIGKVHRGRRWIYNSYKAWAQEIRIYSEKTIFRAIRNLERMGILISDTLHAFKGNRTKWYTIAYEILDDFLSLFQSKKAPKSSTKKMSRPSGQNVQIITKITSNTVLKSASACDPFQPLVEEEQPRSEESPSTVSIVEEAIQILEIINTNLEKPLVLSEPIFKNTIAKRMKSHFGPGQTGLERFRDYCTQWANNAFLMGKKAMKSGDLFQCSIGSILSEKMIEAAWENKGFFQIYVPTQRTRRPQEEDETGVKSDPIPLPYLSLEEVLTTAENTVDREIKKMLYQTLGDVTYRDWFHTMGFVGNGFVNGEPDFFINSIFVRDYVLTHYGAFLRKAMKVSEEGRG